MKSYIQILAPAEPAIAMDVRSTASRKTVGSVAVFVGRCQRFHMWKSRVPTKTRLKEVCLLPFQETVATQQIYKQRLGDIRSDLSRDAEIKTRKLVDQRSFQQDSVDIEKMRSENRLMQDKYTALREKYNKLKNDVRLAVERRRRKVEYTTASETERSTSTRTRTDRTESSEQKWVTINVRLFSWIVRANHLHFLAPRMEHL